MLGGMFHFVYVEVILIILPAFVLLLFYKGPKRLHKDRYLNTSLVFGLRS